jgi:hypothetical protein
MGKVSKNTRKDWIIVLYQLQRVPLTHTVTRKPGLDPILY